MIFSSCSSFFPKTQLNLSGLGAQSMENTFDRELINEIFKRVWRRRAVERGRNELTDTIDGENTEVGAATAKKNRPTSGKQLSATRLLHIANVKALKLSCELLRLFVTEAVQRAAMIAEAEGAGTIEATHLERILPQLLLDF